MCPGYDTNLLDGIAPILEFEDFIVMIPRSTLT